MKTPKAQPVKSFTIALGNGIYQNVNVYADGTEQYGSSYYHSNSFEHSDDY